MRCAVLTLFLLALLTIVLASPAASVPVEAQGSTDVYLTVHVGQGSTEDITGYVRSSYGSIEPSGFRSGPVSGSLSRMTWDDRRTEMRVSLTVIPAYPLTSVATSMDNVYHCSGSDGRNYVCTDPDDDSERPWSAGNELAVRLSFMPDSTAPVAPPGERLPGPTPPSEQLPQAYATKDAVYSIAMHSLNDHFTGFYVEGRRTLYVVDDRDDKVYVYDLRSGNRREIDEWSLGGGTWTGFTHYDGKYWSVASTNDQTPSSSGRYSSSYIYSWEFAGYDSDGNVQMTRVREGVLASTNIRGFYARRMENLGNGEFMLTYSGRAGRWRFDDRSLVPNSLISVGGDNATAFQVEQGRDLLWMREDSGIDDGQDGTGRGVAAYRWSNFLNDRRLVRVPEYDIYTTRNDGTNRSVDYTIWLDQGSNPPYMYTFYSDSSIQDDAATPDVDERNRWIRYNVDPALIVDRTASFGQSAPLLGDVEVDDTHQEGDAQLVDIKIQWEHTSRVTDGVTRMQYRYKSSATGEVGPVGVATHPTEHIIRNLPRANYELLLEFRYYWYNNQPPNAQNESLPHVLIKNPPDADDGECAEDNTDEFPGNDPLRSPPGDNIDATEDSDTESEGCAFYLSPGESRYSDWAEVRVNLTGPLQGVPDASIEIEPYTGLVAATADLLLVMGVEPDGIGPLSHTLTVFGWLILATAVAAGAYVVTGMKTGSAYLATFLWLAIWAGLGPFIAMIPWAMAYLPVAGLLLLGGTLALKRGRM